jgi:adenylate kinase family enzyme
VAIPPRRTALVPLGPDDDVVAAVGHRPQRVLVAGTSGSGKTTLAARIGAAWSIPHTELDGLHWGPDWTPRAEFVDEVRSLVAERAWVAELQYRQVRPLLVARAEVVVWLDLPVRVVMRQVVTRTLRRRFRREPMWASRNVEPPLWTVFAEEDHIVRWAWRTRHKHRDLPEQLATKAPHVVLVRLRSRREVDRWMRRIT